MHSPTRKVTVKEQQDWKIPPCVSNWKNAKGNVPNSTRFLCKIIFSLDLSYENSNLQHLFFLGISGYTIPLDKRLAADGRGLQQQHINENFAKLSDALYRAERKAREAVEARAQLERKMAAKEKEKKEEHLRLMAQRARDQRAGIRNPEEVSFCLIF